MKTFKQFLTEMSDVDFLLHMLERACDRRPQPRVDCDYDGHHHYGIALESPRQNDAHSIFVDYKTWSESEGYIPATLAIYSEDADGFTLVKDVEGVPTLVYRS